MWVGWVKGHDSVFHEFGGSSVQEEHTQSNPATQESTSLCLEIGPALIITPPPNIHLTHPHTRPPIHPLTGT